MTHADAFRIGDKAIGGLAPCFLIAEVGLAHDGSLGNALAYIDAAAAAGVDAVKFQTHIAGAEGTLDEPFRANVFPQDATRSDYWRRTAFAESEWSTLKDHADARGLVFLSTPFSNEAVQLLRRLRIQAWKVGSGEVNNPLLLHELAKGREPVLMSTGMSYLAEIDSAVEIFAGLGIPVALMQCTNRYPCPPEHLGLNVMSEYKARYGVPVGFSDHSGEIATGVAAVALGAKILEVHVTWHKEAFGADVKASLTVDALRELARSVRLIERALVTPIDKDAEAGQLQGMRTLFTKGLVARTDLAEGTVLGPGDIDAKKPCLGVPAALHGSVMGKRTVRPLRKDEPIKLSDLT